jgi:hypothetical protein
LLVDTAAYTNFSLDSACYRQLDKFNKPWNANFMVHPGMGDDRKRERGICFVIVRQNVVVISFGS